MILFRRKGRGEGGRKRELVLSRVIYKLIFYSKVIIRKKKFVVKELICNLIINFKFLSLSSNNYIDSYLKLYEVLGVIFNILCYGYVLSI